LRSSHVNISQEILTYSQPHCRFSSLIQIATYSILNMFPKISLALAGLLSLAVADTLPGTLIIAVVNSTGATIGTLNGYGNFSTPGASYPFRSTQTTGGYADLTGYYRCNAPAGGILGCADGAGASSSFNVSFLAIPGS
jgi:hypothetical protein